MNRRQTECKAKLACAAKPMETCGLEEGVQFFTLTDIIYKTWSYHTAKEYKRLKNLKKENLRDNMTNRELVLNMLAELTTGVLRRALAEFGTPEIFNTDQGSEFTATEFTSILKSASIRVSMDGKGRALDNIFVERFWRTIKYEHITRYNCRRLHQSLAYRTPDSVYRESA